MGDIYNFRAPQYVDFASAMDDNEDDDFFDFDMDTGAPIQQEFTPTDGAIESNPVTPYQDAEDESSPVSIESPKSRRLTSVKQRSIPRRSIFDGIEVEAPPEKAHSMKTRLDSYTRTPRLELRSRSIVKALEESPIGAYSVVKEAQSPQEQREMLSPHNNEREEKETVVKVRVGRKRKLSGSSNHGIDEPPAKFISMAEHIRKLQKQTPARFHTKPRFDGVTRKTFGGPAAPKPITIPQTPALVSHLRTRPVHALTREEEELKEFEEAQKSKFKAAPLKETLFKSTRVAVVEKKPPTQIKPFKLTEYKPKPRVTDDAPVVFKARPVPKTILAGPKVDLPKKRIAGGPPKPAPRIQTAPTKLHPTVTKPFSFEGRGWDPKSKREQMIKEMEEKDRKAKVFKARPLPAKIKAAVESLPKRSQVKAEEVTAEKFKARSPTVLRKAPFIPAKPARTPLEPKPFNLNSEARLKQRHQFDLIIKQKELELESQKRQQEEENARRTAEEIAQLRQQIVHQARPMPSYRPFEVKPSDAPLTQPHSPKFIRRIRHQRAATTEKMNTTFDIEDS